MHSSSVHLNYLKLSLVLTVLTTASYDMSGQSDTQLSKIPEHFVGRDDSPTINVVPSRHEVVRNVDL